MGALAAIFDIDHTLVRGGTERLFFRYLLRHRKLSLSRALSFLVRLAAAPRKRFADKSYLAGMEVADMERLGRRCFQEIIASRLRPQAVARVRTHQSRGYTIVLLSGTLSFLALPLQEHLGADWLIATEINHRDHIFTGEIKGLHPRGKTSESFSRSWLGGRGWTSRARMPMATMQKTSRCSRAWVGRWRSIPPPAWPGRPASAAGPSNISRTWPRKSGGSTEDFKVFSLWCRPYLC
jgi:phosphatidylglycerophosphatase C